MKKELDNHCCGTSHTHDQGHSHDHNHNHDHSHEDVTQTPLPTVATGQEKTRFYIQQMDCPVEEQQIRQALADQSQVIAMQFHLVQRQVDVVHNKGAKQYFIDAVSQLGMEAVEVTAANEQTAKSSNAKQIARIGGAVVLALGAEVGAWLNAPFAVVVALSVIAIALTGLEVYKKGWQALLRRQITINSLMSIAVTGAVLLGEWPEAAMVMSLFALAELIEAYSLDRAHRAVDRLLSLAPDEVDVLMPDGAWQLLPAREVAIGSQVRVKPGARVGLDGVVTQGQSGVNQAPITGESLPVVKKEGDTLYAGSVNGLSELQYQTQGNYDQSLLARIALSVQQAQQSKAPVQRFVDQFARVYTPIVLVLALGIAVLGPLIWGGLWTDWAYKALVLLVVACPCALVISTPVAVVSALTAAARVGLLIKGGVYLERARHLDYVALDKTGTLTLGKPTLQNAWVVATESQADIYAWAYALASRSDHPASMALAQSLPEPTEMMAVTDFQAIAGSGVEATYAGQRWRLGRLAWVSDGKGCTTTDLQQWYDQYLAKGASFVFLSRDSDIVGAFAIADQIKEGVIDAIDELHQLGITIELMSGDNTAAVNHVAQQVNIDQATGELMPDDKLALIQARKKVHRATAMVGDGINDAPALAQADISFAMGALGSDMAIETADIAIMNDDLKAIPYTVRLSRSLNHILLQNISAALGIKGVFLILAVSGIATMWMAVFADVGASLLVVLNSLRLLKR